LWNDKMREVMKDSGELWNEKLSDRPRSVEELPSGSCGSGFDIVVDSSPKSCAALNS